VAKTKRKSNRRPVSKERIEQAKWAKQHGLLSKSAKLGNGKMSRTVAKKVAALESLRAVPTFEYREGMKRARVQDKATRGAVKVSSGYAKDLSARGFQVFNGRVIVPSKDKRFEQALKRGQAAGVKVRERQTDHSGPMIETVDTDEIIELSSHGIDNYKDLFDALFGQRGRAFDRKIKKPDELYSFTIHGFHPRPGRGDVREYYTASELRKYLLRYKWTDAKFEGFQLYRLQPGETLGKTPDEVYREYYKTHPRRKKDKRGNDMTAGNYNELMHPKPRRATEEELKARARASKAKSQQKFRKKQREQIGEDTYRERERIARARRREQSKS
jgi:hypothetical protein